VGNTNQSSVPVRRPDHLFIDGRWVRPHSDSTIDVSDSTTGGHYFSVVGADETDVSRAVAAARAAFDEGPWPRLTHAERAGYLRAIGEALRTSGDAIGELWPRQSGVLHGTAYASAARLAQTWDAYADLADTFPFEERAEPTAGGAFGLLVREPVGVVGAIIAWNGPLPQITHKVAPALLAGCTAVLKASPEAPGEAYVMAEIAERIGLPPGVLNVVTAGREVSEALVRDHRVDKIAFTGSTAVGRRVASLLSERIGRFTLELGGKSAAVILDDSDIDETAETLANAECFLSGQVCSSLSRIVVSRQRHNDLVDALAGAFARIRVGDPFDAATQMGPLASSRQRERVESLIGRGVDEGATLVTGGRRPGGLGEGYFIEPTIMAEVDNSSTIAQEEIFGPVLTVIPADGEDDAVRIANDTIYGLNASVFTKDADHARAVAGRLRSGTVGHNAFRSDFGIAFGGFKQSGIGREGGREGLASFLETKTVILNDVPASYR
jgi:aldehyde dehydrogenase (NAD+)